MMTDFYEESIGLMKWNSDDMLVQFLYSCLMMKLFSVRQLCTRVTVFRAIHVIGKTSSFTKHNASRMKKKNEKW